MIAKLITLSNENNGNGNLGSCSRNADSDCKRVNCD